jgi:uncharacterized membrane protein YeaQ/YmgE (transglycosylase-associated protein family)
VPAGKRTPVFPTPGNLLANFSNVWKNARIKGGPMDVKQVIITLVVGAVAGWLAGLIMKGGGFGLIGNMIVGILGAIVGGFIFGKLGIAVGTGVGGILVSSTVGAMILLFVIGLIKK